MEGWRIEENLLAILDPRSSILYSRLPEISVNPRAVVDKLCGGGDGRSFQPGAADMIIIWGTRLMGKVDVVPGLFHVATQFGHLNFLPLVPLRSYLILSQDGSGFRGMEIGFSFKSMLMAWLRTALFLVAVIASVAAIAAMAASNPKADDWIVPVTIAVAGWTVFALTWHRVASRASFRRACQLGELIGLNEAGFAMLHEMYGEAPPRGFAVNAPVPALPVADVSIVPVSALSRDSYMSTPRAIPLAPLPVPPLEQARETEAGAEPGAEAPGLAGASESAREPDRLGL